MLKFDGGQERGVDHTRKAIPALVPRPVSEIACDGPQYMIHLRLSGTASPVLRHIVQVLFPGNQQSAKLMASERTCKPSVPSEKEEQIRLELRIENM